MANIMIFYEKGKPGSQMYQAFGKKYFRIIINIACVGETHSPYLFTYNEVANWAQKCKYLSDKTKEEALKRALAHLGPPSQK